MFYLPGIMFSQTTVRYSSLSGRLCSWWKPSACPISCNILPLLHVIVTLLPYGVGVLHDMSAYSVPMEPTEMTWRPPIRPILEEQLKGNNYKYIVRWFEKQLFLFAWGDWAEQTVQSKTWNNRYKHWYNSLTKPPAPDIASGRCADSTHTISSHTLPHMQTRYNRLRTASLWKWCTTCLAIPS